MARGCVWHDAGGVVNVDNLEALSIVTAAILFVLEGGKRRQREHVEAMELVYSCQEHRIRLSHARNEALEQLCEAGIELHGLDLSGADLSEIRLPAARLQGVKLVGTDLSRADLRGADLRGADLSGALLDGALPKGLEPGGAERRC
ncbi:MAG: pentapeptide repeat-containing protein [Cyanobacteria bacterium M_surface_10_m2_119]|nr:pentapeptide repeat-containing protein [Cyanobacteria bacterium M_surface_10_m2_119]